MADAPLLWHAPTHTRTERSVDWFWALGVIALSGAVLSILFGNILFALIIILGATLIAVLALREPHDCEVEISEQGIRIRHSLYPYRSLSSFWIDADRDDPHLLVKPNTWLTPQLSLPIPPAIDQSLLRARLIKNLPEEEQHESPLAHVGTLLGL